MFECSTNGFGIHDIEQTDLIASSKEVIKNKVVGKGISVDRFVGSNPCDNRKSITTVVSQVGENPLFRKE